MKSKDNSIKLLTIILVSLLLLASFLLSFYWFALRPAQIRKECSWVKKFQEATEYVPSKTEEQLWSEGVLQDCNSENQGSIFDFKDFCEHRNKVFIESHKNEKPAQPAREWYDKADDQEYEFCIRSKGLIK